LSPGAVTPEGWLGLYLNKQAKGLSLHLPEVARPFTGAFWAGEENYDRWWPWEQKGYWTDGALRCALVTGDEQLMKVARAPVGYTLSHPFPDGYLGPALIRNGQGPLRKVKLLMNQGVKLVVLKRLASAVQLRPWPPSFQRT
jgi:hypothetical protein